MESPYKGKTGLRRLLNAASYSFSGLAAAAPFQLLVQLGWMSAPYQAMNSALKKRVEVS